MSDDHTTADTGSAADTTTGVFRSDQRLSTR